MCLVDDPVLFFGPWRLLHLRVQVVVPALAALLADTTLQVLGDHRPALCSVLLDQLDHLARWAFVWERGEGRRNGREVNGEKRGRKEKQQEGEGTVKGQRVRKVKWKDYRYKSGRREKKLLDICEVIYRVCNWTLLMSSWFLNKWADWEHLVKPSEGVSSDILATLLIITTGWKYNSSGLVR